MGEHFLLGIGLDLCLCIFTKLYPHVDALRATESVNNDSENAASVDLLLFEPQFKSTFVRTEVHLSIYDLVNRSLSMQVFAELEGHETEGYSTFSDANIQSIIQDYSNLKPIVREGMIHYADDFDPKKGKRKVNRTLAVRYRVFDEEIPENLDYDYGYEIDIDKIAESTMPYLLSLREIRRKYIIELGSKNDESG
jgi:hypothetical protein